MDYVLFGMGYGSTLMLLGWALRTYGPQLKYSRPPQQEDADFLVQRRFWVRFVQGLGGVIAIAGTTMVLMTFVVVLMNPTDDTGMTISMAIWGFILAVVLIWCGLYLSRFGLTGIWSRGSGYGFNRKAGIASARNPVRKAATADDEIVITIDDHALPTTAYDADVATSSGAEIVQHDGDSEPPEQDMLEERSSTDPVYDFGDGSETTVPRDAGGRAEALRRLRQRQARSGQSST